MQIRLRCFAAVRDLLGADSLTMQVPEGATLDTLKAELARQNPAFARLHVACAVNRTYARADQLLREGDEVAFIPPISGGSGAATGFAFVAGPLDARALEAQVRTGADGAVVTFAGTARNHHDGQAVRGLRYEAYTEMAVPLVERILQQALTKFEITAARAAHRLGEVPIGEAAVLVVVAAPHRGPAFGACQWIMDRIKAEAPIFKQEELEQNAQRWVGELPQSPQ